MPVWPIGWVVTEKFKSRKVKHQNFTGERECESVKDEIPLLIYRALAFIVSRTRSGSSVIKELIVLGDENGIEN